MEIKLRESLTAGLALTETCRDREEFRRAVASRSASALALHLAHCPACRTVAHSAVAALVSAGDPLLPDRTVQETAREILERKKKESDEEIRRLLFNVFITPTGLESAESSKEETVQFNRGEGLRFRIPFAEGMLQMECERDGEVFLLRFRAARSDVARIRRLVPEKEDSFRPLRPAVVYGPLRPGEFQFLLRGGNETTRIQVRIASRR